MIDFLQTSSERPLRANAFALQMSFYIVGAILITVVMFYALDRGNVFTYSPWHHDDYGELYRIDNYWPDFHVARPVTQFIYHSLAHAGPLIFYLALHALLAVDLALIFLLALEILDPDRISSGARRWAFLFGTIASSSSPDLPAIVKYTGNIDHLISLLFGISSVLLLSRSRKTGSLALVAGSVLLFALSILAKEDTLLLLGAMALLTGVSALRSDQRWSYKAGLSIAGLASLGFVAFLLLHPAAENAWFFVRHTLQSDAGAYSIHTGSGELAAVVRFLVWPSAYYKLAHLAFFALAFLHVALLRKAAALKALLIFVALATPYALLGMGHIYGYNRFNSSPFAVYCAFIMGVDLARWVQARNWIRPQWKPAAGAVWAAAWVATAVLLFQVGKGERRAILAWHNNLQAISQKVLAEVTEMAPALKTYKEIHVVGADNPINPFFWGEGVVYINREILQAPVRWIIHYRKESELGERLSAYLRGTEDPIITYVTSDGASVDAPRIEVDASFNTRFVTTP